MTLAGAQASLGGQIFRAQLTLSKGSGTTVVPLGVTSLRSVGQYIGAIAWRICGIHVNRDQVIPTTGLGLVSGALEGACVVGCRGALDRITAVTFAVVLQACISKVVS